jgi:hypothetical protein
MVLDSSGSRQRPVRIYVNTVINILILQNGGRFF